MCICVSGSIVFSLNYVRVRAKFMGFVGSGLLSIFLVSKRLDDTEVSVRSRADVYAYYVLVGFCIS